MPPHPTLSPWGEGYLLHHLPFFKDEGAFEADVLGRAADKDFKIAGFGDPVLLIHIIKRHRPLIKPEIHGLRLAGLKDNPLEAL